MPLSAKRVTIPLPVDNETYIAEAKTFFQETFKFSKAFKYACDPSKNKITVSEVTAAQFKMSDIGQEKQERI